MVLRAVARQTLLEGRVRDEIPLDQKVVVVEMPAEKVLLEEMLVEREW
jgi:hypothetical protein